MAPGFIVVLFANPLRRPAVFLSLALALSSFLAVPLGVVVSNAACSPDFSINVTPTSLTLVKGGLVKNIGVGFTSICGLAGTINFGIHGVSPQPAVTCTNKGGCVSNGILFKQCCYDLPLKANGSTGNHITANATVNTLATTYQVRITGTDISGGCCYGISHSQNVTITVAACCEPDFTVSASPSNFSKIRPGQTVGSTITATGLNGFNGTVYYFYSISPSTVTTAACNLYPDRATLTPTQTTGTSQLSCSFSSKGSYTVTITADTPVSSRTRTNTVSIDVT